jgi:hypothetical protein
MRKHRGLAIFGAVAVLAALAYLGPIHTADRDRDDRRADALRPDVEALASRLGHAREADVTALTDLSTRLSEIFPPPGDRWTRFGQEGVVRLGAVFRDAFMAWHERLLADGVLTPRAWPQTGWRTGGRHPSNQEMARTLRLCLLLEGLGRSLVSETGGLITGITEPENADEVVVDFIFEPDRVKGLFETLTAMHLGGETFVLLDLETSVRDAGPGTGRARLRMVETE